MAVIEREVERPPDTLTVESTRRQPVLSGLLAAWSIGAVISLFVWRNFTVDDAFIGWRHGLNLVEHGRYTFNPVGDRIEAATSPLQGLSAAIPVALGIDVVLFFKLAALAVIAGYIAIALRATTNTATRLVFMLLAVGGPVQALHLWGGLETGVFVMLATAVCAAAVGVLSVRPVMFGAVAALLVMTRLEGLLLVLPAVALIHLGGVTMRTPVAEMAARVWRCRVAWLPSVATATAITVARWIYFGSPLPNSFSTKAGQQRSLTVMLSTAWDHRETFVELLLVTVVVVLLADRSRRRRLVVMLASSVFVATVLYLPSTLAMNYAVRFPYQILWPVALAAVLCITVMDWRRTAALLACSVWLTMMVGTASLRELAEYYPRMTNAMLEVGDALTQADEPGVVVVGDAGLIPYASGWDVLDTGFLGTPGSIGMFGIAERIADNPDTVLVLYATGPMLDDASDGFLTQAATDAGYEFVGGVEFRPSYWYHVWVGPGYQTDTELRAALDDAVRTSRSNSDIGFDDAAFGWWWSE